MGKKSETVRPKTIAKGETLMTPEQLLAEQKKQQIEQQRKELKARLLKSGGYLS